MVTACSTSAIRPISPRSGLWKLLGAIAITVPGLPRVKEWAYAGFAFDLTAAAMSHASVGDSTGEIVGPLVFLALVTASWALRPASRKLTAAPASARESLATNPAGSLAVALP